MFEIFELLGLLFMIFIAIVVFIYVIWGIFVITIFFGTVGNSLTKGFKSIQNCLNNKKKEKYIFIEKE